MPLYVDLKWLDNNEAEKIILKIYYTITMKCWQNRVGISILILEISLTTLEWLMPELEHLCLCTHVFVATFDFCYSRRKLDIQLIPSSLCSETNSNPKEGAFCRMFWITFIKYLLARKRNFSFSPHHMLVQ